jgi:hypothetical protein
LDLYKITWLIWNYIIFCFMSQYSFAASRQLRHFPGEPVEEKRHKPVNETMWNYIDVFVCICICICILRERERETSLEKNYMQRETFVFIETDLCLFIWICEYFRWFLYTVIVHFQ